MKQEVGKGGAMGVVIMRNLTRLYGIGDYIYDRSRDYRCVGEEVLAGLGHVEGEELDV